MKSTFLILFILYSNFLFLAAQVWCPTGATWVYETLAVAGEHGIKNIHYVKDTLILDKSCKQLEVTGFYYINPIPGQYFGPISMGTDYIYTYQNLDSIFYLVANSWQLKFLFNQPIGSSFTTIQKVFSVTRFFNDTTQNETVYDTNTLNLNGHLLKSYKTFDTIVNVDTPIFGSLYCTKSKIVVERIGELGDNYALTVYSCGNGFYDELLLHLKCYYDSSGEYYHEDLIHACDYIYNNIQDKSKNQLTTVYPNPTSNKISFNLAELNLSDESLNHIKIVDLYGKVVVEQTIDKSTINNIQSIDLSQLNSGTYILFVGNNQSKIIKY